MNDQLVTIATFDNSFAAESAKALLESSQIETFLLNSHASSIRPSLALHGGVRLQVLESQAEDAIAILRAHYPPEEDHKKTICCPSCQSRDIFHEKRGWRTWARIILSLGLMLAIPGQSALTCRSCGHSWKTDS